MSFQDIEKDAGNLKIATRFANHHNCLLIVTAQNLYSNSVFRQFLRQASYIWLLNSPRLYSSLRTLSSQIFSDSKFLPSVAQYLVQHKVLCLDLDGATPTCLRLRSLDAEASNIEVFMPNGGIQEIPSDGDPIGSSRQTRG